MTHSKKTLQSYLMTLRAFADCYNSSCVFGRHLIYEVNCLVRDSSSILRKHIYYVPGHSILPDDPGNVESCWIHVLTSKEVSELIEKCIKYGIEIKEIKERKSSY